MYPWNFDKAQYSSSPFFPYSRKIRKLPAQKPRTNRRTEHFQMGKCKIFDPVASVFKQWVPCEKIQMMINNVYPFQYASHFKCSNTSLWISYSEWNHQINIKYTNLLPIHFVSYCHYKSFQGYKYSLHHSWLLFCLLLRSRLFIYFFFLPDQHQQEKWSLVAF